ncbi:hypothetical protein N2152v2_003640 [Parachlorella kessleri]
MATDGKACGTGFSKGGAYQPSPLKEPEERIAAFRRKPDVELAPSPSTLYIGPSEQDAASRSDLVVQRWQRAVKSVINSRAMTRDMDLLNERLAPGEDRLHALIDLEVRLATLSQPQRKQLVAALLRRREDQYISLKDHLLHELFITGEKIFDFCTPSDMGHHGLYFTVSFIFLIAVAFWFMAGLYPAYKAVKQPSSLACLAQQQQNGTSPFGPAQVQRWMSPKDATWCFGGTPGHFDAEFLILWGARWGPDMMKEPQRWITSIFLHQNFLHLLSNCLLFAGLATQMEANAVFENTCVAVVGASGGIFGIFGLFIADMVMNFETLQRPLMRSMILLAFFIFFVVTIATTPSGTSHLSHVGGFLCGLFPAFLFLPNLHSERWEAWLPYVGGLLAIVIYVTLPAYFYRHIYQNISC